MKTGLLPALVTLACALQSGALVDAPAYRVLVTGEVRYPGRATLTASTMTVLDALAAVGSPTQTAGDEVIVIHLSPRGEPERRTMAISEMEVGKAGLDVALQDGDIVNVPLGKRFYVSGFVKKPGAYKLLAGMTVGQALALVGGVADGGNDRHIKIGRVVNGRATEVAARLDDKILPNDEIKVQRRMF